LLDWQLRWFCSLENPVHIESARPPQLGDAGAIRHESAELRVFLGRERRRQRVLCDQLDDPSALRKQHRTRKHKHRLCALGNDPGECAVDLVGVARRREMGCRLSAFAACVTSATRLRIVASPKAPGCQRTPTRESVGSPSLSRAKRLGTSSSTYRTRRPSPNPRKCGWATFGATSCKIRWPGLWRCPRSKWPFHSITSSARASSVGGTSRPSVFAVLRLITNSYLVGACTGRSAGFSPRKMRST